MENVLLEHSAYRTVPPQRESLNKQQRVQMHNQLVMICMLTVVTLLLSALLFVVIMRRARLRRDFFMQLIANLVAGAILFNLAARPGAIQEETGTTVLSVGYCGFYLIVLGMESIFIPYTCIFLIIERIMAIAAPEKYARRLSIFRRIILFGILWICCFVFGIVWTVGFSDGIISHYGSFPDDAYYNQRSEPVSMDCMLIYNKGSDLAIVTRMVIGDILTLQLPLVLIFILSVVLIILYCRKSKIDPDMGSHLDENRPVVQKASVVFVLMVNLVLLVFLTTDQATVSKYVLLGTSHWKFCVFELTAAVLGLTMLPGVRNALDMIFCCQMRDGENRESLIAVTTRGDDTSDEFNNDELGVEKY